jgi:site-specific DNA recombinase
MPEIKFVALARVSSREQEREGFSLEVQESALRAYAERKGGVIEPMFRVAETASKREERKVFRELLDHCRTHAGEIAGVLFYKVDRAARNLFDYVELERLETEHGVPVHFVSQPSENTPAGRMQRRMLGNIAAFYTEQQSQDVREGMLRRVQSGLFVGYAPFGYRNARVDGRGVIETHPERAAIVAQIFAWYAESRVTVDQIRERLLENEMYPGGWRGRFSRNKLYQMLSDRSYLGEVPFKGRWYPGVHEPLIDGATFARVQALLGGRQNRALDLLYGGKFMACGHCGRVVTGEQVQKSYPGTGRAATYVYYRCVGYRAAGHPRVRLREAEVDAQVLRMFAGLRMEQESLRAWVVEMLKARQAAAFARGDEAIKRAQGDLDRARKESETLFQMRLGNEISPEVFRAKSAEIEGRIARLELQRGQHQKKDAEGKDLALKVFELSQTLTEKWVTSDAQTRRKLLQIVVSNVVLDGETLVFTLRKPFDMLNQNGFVEMVGVGGTGVELIETFRGACGPLGGLLDRLAA